MASAFIGVLGRTLGGDALESIMGSGSGEEKKPEPPPPPPQGQDGQDSNSV